MSKTQLIKYFKVKLHSTSDVARGKPFADVYLQAASAMGVSDVSKCLVIEDSPLGVQGGVNAGMTVFGYTELMSKKKLKDAGAHHTFNSMDALIGEIKKFE